MITDVLISFVGAQDPFSAKRGRAEDGPILTLCRQRSFGSVILLYTPDEESEERAKNTASQLIGIQTERQAVGKVALPIDDPTNHGLILNALRNWWAKYPKEPGCEYYISISSGTPAMHVAWLLLAASDEIHANVLYVRNPLYVDEGQPLVGEINPRSPDFPAINTRASLAEIAHPTLIPAVEFSRECGLHGEGPAFREALERAARYAPYEHPVLILGETGTGKERFARFIHDAGKRAKAPFVPINCGALPATLIESELFGHVKGSFTGADMDKKGAFEEAHGGTLFLDEIGDMPLEMQVKLLRVIQEHKIRPVGGKEKPVDVRIIAATHRNIEKAQKQGIFREDLYMRLNVLPLSLPALRDRREDIVPIALSFLEKENKAHGAHRKFSPEVFDRLLAASWPGNIRELENVVKLAFVMTDGDLIEAKHLRLCQESDENIPLPRIFHGFSLKTYIENLRDQLYAEAMRISGNNLSEAGRLLGVSAEAVRKELAKHTS